MGRGRQADARRDAWLHSVMAGLGALIVLVLSGVLLVEGLEDGGGEPPDIRVTQTGAARVGAAHVVTVRAENAGGRPAADVTIEGALADGETAQMILDHLPDGSRRTGGLIFQGDPAQGVRFRVLGYRDP